MGVGALIGVIGGVVGVLGAVIGYTKFVAQAPLQARVTELEGENRRQEERAAELQQRHEEALAREGRRFSELEANYQNLVQDFSNLKRGKSGVLVKNEIDIGLEKAMKLLQARESSVLVPAPPPSSSFVFLSIYGPAAARLRYSKLPLGKGKAGKVYATGRLDNSADPRKDPEFFEGMDRKGEHTTRTLLTVPLDHEGKTLGVMQFLNKEGDRAFTPQDESTATELARDLASRVAEFVRDSANFELLGLSAEQRAREETIVFCDLSASSRLFETVAPGDAIDCINEYFERHSEIAIAHGASVDKYLGDGIMFRFAPHARHDSDYAPRAAMAALAMCDDFDALKQSWLNFEMDIGELHDRFGLATGPVYEAILGHRQIRSVTVIGDTVNRAANLVEASTRARNVILVDAATRSLIGDGFATEQLAGDAASKVKASDGGPFYELLSFNRSSPLAGGVAAAGLRGD